MLPNKYRDREDHPLVTQASAGKSALETHGVKLDGFPTIDPDDIAEEIWALITRRDRAEAILSPLPAA
ncbi:hypothetical protein [Rhizobium sp. YTU87027]|uniref:hypothetical protein n=1 Tax=Rhizobium sp. YTU87027 TaxID=3417741 RepID=UPI003D6839FF